MSGDEDLCQQVWAVGALQNGRVGLAARYLRIPREVVGAKLGDANHIPPWILETVVNERFALPPFAPQHRGGGMERKLRSDTFASIHQTCGFLRAAENAEQGVLLERFDVLKELPRLMHRQFEWGRGFMNGPQVYRSAFLYGGPQAQSHFALKHGLSLTDFILFGVAAASQFQEEVVHKPIFDFAEIGLDAAACESALGLLTLPAAQARAAVKSLRLPFRGSLYQPSLLRRTPILAFGEKAERLRAPLPDLIMQRVTSGLFYDLVDAQSGVRNEVADRFEVYVCDLLNASLPGLQSSKGGKYALGKTERDLPDVLIQEGGRLAAVVECKARKMTFSARYGEHPETETAVEELVKGVVQLWRFFAHDRLGFSPGPRADAGSIAMLLTLENWTQMNRGLQGIILERAKISASRDPHIRLEDRRTVVFASIEDLETTLERSDEAGFLHALAEATTDRFVGWTLPNIFRDVETGVERPYPLASRLGEVLPWWEMIRDDQDPQAAGG